MKLNNPRILLVLTILLCSTPLLCAQGVPSELRSTPEEVAKAEARIREIFFKAERAFKQGLLNLKDNKRALARDDFDHSVEAFLLSGINVRTDPKLQRCYSELIETIYRIEVPSIQVPEIKGLAVTCSWTLENEYGEIAIALQNSAISRLQAADNARVATADSNDLPIAPQTGFVEQKHETSPLDELAKLELTPEEEKAGTPERRASDKYVKSGDRKAISDRTGVSVEQLQAQNVGVIKSVKAKAGDTVRAIALRYQVSVLELAKFNGLLPDSPLIQGREIKIPPVKTSPFLHGDQYIKVSTIEKDTLGDKPVQLKNGKVQLIMSYFNENLNDPYTLRLVRWSPITKVYMGSTPYWLISVKYRAKNGFGAYILTETVFYIQKNKIVKTRNL